MKLRPQMTSVYFQLNNEGVTFVATDAHKLVRYWHYRYYREDAASLFNAKKHNL